MMAATSQSTTALVPVKPARQPLVPEDLSSDKKVAAFLAKLLPATRDAQGGRDEPGPLVRP